MSPTDNDIDWSLTSWEGSRRAQLRRWLALTVRERLQAIEEMVEVSARIASSLRPSERNASTDIPAPAADTGKGVPGQKGGHSSG
jgi:CRISPR-associated protein Csx17